MCSDSRRADLLAVLGNRSQPEGTRKSGSLENSAAVQPCEPDFSGCLYANGLGRAGMRKTGSFEKSMAPAGGA